MGGWKIRRSHTGQLPGGEQTASVNLRSPQAGWQQICTPSFSSCFLKGDSRLRWPVSWVGPSTTPLPGPEGASAWRRGCAVNQQRVPEDQVVLNTYCLMAYEMIFQPRRRLFQRAVGPQTGHRGRRSFCYPFSFREPFIQKSNIENVIHSPIVYLNDTNGWSLKISCHFFTI